jgi:hypothetical protein
LVIGGETRYVIGFRILSLFLILSKDIEEVLKSEGKDRKRSTRECMFLPPYPLNGVGG